MGCMLTLSVAAQGTVRGRVQDSRSGEDIEYATVALLRVQDSTLVAGTVTESNGTFTLKAPLGNYLLRITFIGYEPYYHPQHVRLTSDKSTINLGKLQIGATATLMDAVEVVAERSMVEYQLDKRVINVDKNIVTGGGTATDVLEQVPSVAIDNDGNVTLRGSTNVKVLINGRPSELLASDLETLLEQIPASTVENIEVITNPSAKYDPEGMSGIINIKLKDRSTGALGTNGVVNINFGAPMPFAVPDELGTHFLPTTNGNISLNYSAKKYSITFNADAGLRNRAGRSHNDIARKNSSGTVLSHDSLFSFSQNPSRSGSAKLGFEYYIDSTQSILLSYQLRGGKRMRKSGVNSTDLLTNGYLDYYQADTNSNSYANHSINLSYVKRFAKPDQQLTFDATGSFRRGSGDATQEQTYTDPTANHLHRYLRTTDRLNNGQNANLQLNYTHPFSPALRLETGYEGRMQWSDQEYEYYTTTDTTTHVLDDAASMHYKYNQQVHAAYATMGYKFSDRLSAQAGLRGEYATVSGKDLRHPLADPVSKDYWQLYPTLHISYQIAQEQSIQLSYSKRVRRPHMWDLNPYLDVRQGMEMSFGNPGLDPEYTHALEVSYNLGFRQTNIFASAYFRQTNNMMTRYGFVWDATSAAHYAPWMTYNPEYDGYWASTWQNLNRGINWGLELIIDQQLTKWWKVNLSLNGFQSYIEGTELLGGTDRSAFRLGGKFNSYMNLPHDWTLQASFQYNAPFMDLQTDMKASYWVDLAVKKDILNHRGTLNLRVSDVLCTGGFGHTTHTEQLDREFSMRRISPVITIGFSYKINNGLRPSRKQQAETDDSDEGSSEY